tara:strand:- start:426 stop:743 length:318 start_codon:yes stop_codon:yes gene_type:complete
MLYNKKTGEVLEDKSSEDTVEVEEVHTMEDIPRLVKDESFHEAIEVVRKEGIDIKYGPMNTTRKRAALNELRTIAYTLQRDARAASSDTSVIRDVIKSLNVGSSY